MKYIYTTLTYGLVASAGILGPRQEPYAQSSQPAVYGDTSSSSTDDKGSSSLPSPSGYGSSTWSSTPTSIQWSSTSASTQWSSTPASTYSVTTPSSTAWTSSAPPTYGEKTETVRNRNWIMIIGLEPLTESAGHCYRRENRHREIYGYSHPGKDRNGRAHKYRYPGKSSQRTSPQQILGRARKHQRPS